MSGELCADGDGCGVLRLSISLYVPVLMAEWKGVKNWYTISNILIMV